MVPVVSSVLVLLGQSLQKGRKQQHTCLVSHHDDLLYTYEACHSTCLKEFSTLTSICIRAAFLPVLIVSLPLPQTITKHFPYETVRVFQWFAFWTFAGLLIVPWLLCIYQLITHSLGRTPLIKHILDESAAPKIVVVVPCYKEPPDILLRTLNSIVGCDYPPACLHTFLSFDGDQEDDHYLTTLAKLGVPMLRRSGYPTSIDVIYHNTRVTVSRFPHGGKRHCQKRTFKLMDRIYHRYLRCNDNLFVLFIDSDCILDKACIQNFMYEMVSRCTVALS